MQHNSDNDKIKRLLDEYEALIPTLNEQLESYQAEHGQLKAEIFNLAKKLEEHLSRHSLQSVGFAQHLEDGDFISNLKNQLTYSVKEKESVRELWKASLQTIDHLEEELRYYEGDAKTKNMVHKIKKIHSDEVLQLKSEIKKLNNKLKVTVKSSTSIIQEKTMELKQTICTQNKTISQISKLEAEMNSLQDKYTTMFKMKEILEQKIEEKNTIIANLKINETTSKTKFIEILHLIEAAILERDGAIIREKEAKEEVQKLTKDLSQSMDNISSVLKKDVEAIKEEYYDKVKKLKRDLENAQETVICTTLEIEKRKMQVKQLDEEIERSRASNYQHGPTNTSHMMILENNLESTFQKLLLSERKNMQLTSDIEALKDDLKQMAMHYEKDINMREIEKKSYKIKINKLQNELQKSNRTVIKVATKVEQLNERIAKMDTEFRKEFKMKEVNSEYTLSSKISQIEVANRKINNELKTQLESQINLNKRWKVEVRDIIDSLDNKIQDLCNEKSRLHENKIELLKKLAASENKSLEYKEHLITLSTELNVITNIPKTQ